ncbi:MAG: hypothetical protein R3282_06485 [Rhodothermales bacterium]|nr:hypothetical protein [Rhodothermales bacterium]
MSIDTHNLRVDFGKHRGERWTRLPVSYLRWIVNLSPPHSCAEIAKAELERRNIPLVNVDVEISGHAIDSASLRLQKQWHDTRHENEGLHSWLQRICVHALDKDDPDSEGRLDWYGVRLVFEEGALVPILKTCMPIKSKRQRKRAELDIEDTFHPHDPYALGQE